MTRLAGKQDRIFPLDIYLFLLEDDKFLSPLSHRDGRKKVGIFNNKIKYEIRKYFSLAENW